MEPSWPPGRCLIGRRFKTILILGHVAEVADVLRTPKIVYSLATVRVGTDDAATMVTSGR